ncbi:alpha/beta hydrolase [Syntrophomonas palmitatica]|uniref:alpha/beta hydrolase n=1 Tax=Syntrophomonas palmitatica TaxID=402877 RepID=UPI0006D07C4C|nr:alpha/beta hydrolase [Syntrophomonas palmitatica]
MLSLRARIIKSIMQRRKNKQEIDWYQYEAVLRFRQQVEAGASRFGKLPDGIEVEPVSIGDMAAEWITPSQVLKDQVMLYFHGGGYVSGTCQSHRAIVAKFVRRSGLPALLFEYRLAPEHPFPAALDDAVIAYSWLLDQGISSSNIALLGDSAGGGLVLATLLALRDKGISLPAAAAVYSPVTDYTCSGESYRTNAKVCLSPKGIAPAFARHYAGDLDPGLPYISPLFGDLHGLPPLLILVGSDETLLDDATRFAAKAKACGVDVTLRIEPGMFHCYPAMAPLFPEATRAMKEICRFIQLKLGK